MCGAVVGKPSKLGQNSHSHDTHHGAVLPLTGLYSAPPPDPALPLYAAPSLLPAYTGPAAPIPAPRPAPMMMMDPSYQFEYSGAGGRREEESDSSGLIRGSYGYTGPGGEPIEVHYIAGADTGFTITNQAELAAAVGRAVAEPASPPTPYTGEIVAVERSEPIVDSSMALGQHYRYAWRGAGQTVEQEADSAGAVKGSYSYTAPDGQPIEVHYTAGPAGFVVENLEELQSTLHPVDPAQQAEPTVVAARSQPQPDLAQAGTESDLAPAALAYVHDPTGDTAEVYIHEDIPALEYRHEEITAEPDIHQEDELEAESRRAETTSLSAYSGRRVKKVKRVKVAGRAGPRLDASFSFSSRGADQEFSEKADESGERRGSYSYTNPAGDLVTVLYTAGRNGFVILNPQEVLPQPIPT